MTVDEPLRWDWERDSDHSSFFWRIYETNGENSKDSEFTKNSPPKQKDPKKTKKHVKKQQVDCKMGDFGLVFFHEVLFLLKDLLWRDFFGEKKTVDFFV